MFTGVIKITTVVYFFPDTLYNNFETEHQIHESLLKGIWNSVHINVS